MEHICLFIGITAGIIQIIGYAMYMRNAFSGSVSPNPASWSIWAFASILNLVSYIEMTGDLSKVILPAACSVMNMGTFLVCLLKGRLRKLQRFEKIILILDLKIVLIWWLSHSALLANLLLQISTLISFIPITHDVWKNPKVEKPAPWFLWTSGYALLSLLVIFRWQQWHDVVYPISCLIFHSIVFYICKYKKVSPIS